MSDYDDTNRGALFKNERKEQETHADYNGTINVGGQGSHSSMQSDTTLAFSTIFAPSRL